MTKIEMFTAIASFIPADRTDLTAFIEKEIGQIVKKNSYVSSKPSKKQVENECYKADILYTLATASEPMKIADIINTNEHLYGDSITSQRVSALLTQLKQEGKVKRLEGRTALFTLADADEESEEE